MGESLWVIQLAGERTHSVCVYRGPAMRLALCHMLQRLWTANKTCSSLEGEAGTHH